MRILDEMTPGEYREAHRELWDWLAAHPYEGKHSWPGWAECDDAPINLCFPCELHSKQFIAGEDCGESAPCPAAWPGSGACIDGRGLYGEWMDASGARRAEIARQIRDLPWRGMEGAR